MPSVFYRSPGQEYPLAVRGEGVYLYDDKGRQYLDGSGGAAISCLGHAHPVVVAAVKQQLEDMAFAHTSFFTNEPQEALAAKLAERFGEPGAWVYFLSGGSEANEAAIKMARQYWLALGHDNKHIVISRRQGYHGNTLGALSVTGNLARRAPYQPLLHDWPRIEPCYSFRLRREGESETEYGKRSAMALEQAILEQGADNVSAFIAETVVGASLGAVTAAVEYFREIRAICDRHDVLLILDEVMAGAGRTGSYFAFEQEGITPDIVTLAKGLGGGYQPIGAAIARGSVHAAIVEGPGAFAHGHTYVGHASACAAGLAVLEVLEGEDLLKGVRHKGDELRNTLEAAFADHPHVGDIRGRGLLMGLELVADRDSMQPVSHELGVARKIRQAAMDNGLICYPVGGTVDGVDGAHVLLAPPFIIKSGQLGELAGKLRASIDQVAYA